MVKNLRVTEKYEKALVHRNLPFASNDAIMESRCPIITDHAHHWLILFIGLLHLVVSVDRCGFVVTVGRGHRPPGPRVCGQVQRVHLMRGGHRQLRQVAGPQPFHVERHVEALLAATSATAAVAVAHACGHQCRLATDGPEARHVTDDGSGVVACCHT